MLWISFSSKVFDNKYNLIQCSDYESLESIMFKLLNKINNWIGWKININHICYYFKSHHKKVYKSPIEDGYRMKIFLDNKRKVLEHNRKYEMKEVSYKLGMNKYADMVRSRKQIVCIGKRAILKMHISLVAASWICQHFEWFQ